MCHLHGPVARPAGHLVTVTVPSQRNSAVVCSCQNCRYPARVPSSALPPLSLLLMGGSASCRLNPGQFSDFFSCYIHLLRALVLLLSLGLVGSPSCALFFLWLWLPPGPEAVQGGWRLEAGECCGSVLVQQDGMERGGTMLPHQRYFCNCQTCL